MKLHFVHIFKYDRNYNTLLRYVMDTVQNTKCSLNEKKYFMTLEKVS